MVDHIGKPVVMLDASRRVTGAADYDPFGHVNRVSQVAETAHPYTSGSSVSLGTLTQPVSAGVEVVRMRALYHLVDTQSGAASVSLVDVDTAASLDSTSEVRNGNVVTPWVQPANGRVEVRFVASATAAPGYQGVVLEGYEYQRYQSGAQPFWIPLRFPGQYHDDETGFAENWNRFYNPSIGRYLQPEPMLQSPNFVKGMASQGMSAPAYAYANNDPLHFTDPTGLEVRLETDRYWDLMQSAMSRLRNCPAVGQWMAKCFGSNPFTNSSDHLVRYFHDESPLGCWQSGTAATTNWFSNTTNICSSMFQSRIFSGSGTWRGEREMAATMLHELSHQLSLGTNDALTRLGAASPDGECSAVAAEKLAYKLYDQGCGAIDGCK
ncbi:RHS repeat-associated core domain-containing protein [Corallococcus macrosporus]|uniref:Uncharacterized protein n=1 Tax=Corallococcus macrosporus DSM 14697 TaxID=1189310 RepID=A0A250K0E4_9BACT|nr:RHS repeat-associated core domain-containing protein [Corallococcus macrosporus]ATB49360.1 hypothetical protein MYMAC_005003 [Corallococcus macrosporus DSM 14697]